MDVDCKQHEMFNVCGSHQLISPQHHHLAGSFAKRQKTQRNLPSGYIILLKSFD